MNKKKFNISNLFNEKLFVEAFKQIRVVGLTAFVILGALGVFMPLLHMIENNESLSHYQSAQLFDTDAFMWPLLALIFIVAPLMFIMLFNFLTKRSGSDFYHSLPVKRITLFTTFTTAIMAWVVMLAIIYTFILLITTSITLPYYVIDNITIINYIVNTIVGCLLIISTFSIGISLTGTITSNIVFSCGILIIPRLVITILSYMTITSSNTMTTDGHLIFNFLANIPFALITCLFGFNNQALYNMLLLGEHTYYSLGLSIIYLIIGIKLFISRPSEISTKSFRSEKVFSILRFSAGFLISLFIIGYTFGKTPEDIADNLSYKFSSIILVIFAITVLMFALEAAHKKSVKKGFKGILYAPIIILTDIALIFVMYMTVQYYNNETFNKDDIDYIYITDASDIYQSITYNDEYYYEVYSYFKEMISNVKVTDRNIVDYLVDIHNTDRSDPSNYCHPIKITFDSPLYNETRLVYLDNLEIKALANKLMEVDSFKERFYNYPSVNSAIAVDCEEATIAQSNEIYRTYLSELKNLTTEQLVDIALEANYKFDPIDYIYISMHVNGRMCHMQLPICSLMPETVMQYINSINKNTKNRLDNFIDFIEKGASPHDYHLRADADYLLQNSDPNTNVTIDVDITEKPEKQKELLKLLKEAVNSDFKFDKTHLADEKQYICKIFFAEHTDGLSDLYGSYYLSIPADSPLIERYEYNDYSEFDLIEIHEDEYGNITNVYIDEDGHRYEEYIPYTE